jgi:UPF0716 family protein affecting phage T7 exclusion
MTNMKWTARGFEVAGLMALGAVFGYLLGYMVVAIPFSTVEIAMALAAATVLGVCWTIGELE